MSSTIQISSTLTLSATPTCTSVTPGRNGYVPADACGANWNYDPSFGAAIFLSVAFGLSFLIHICQAFVYKKWKLCWVIIMGVAWELTSFITRALGSRDQQNSAYPYASTILFLLAPMWVNAFDYMIMGRMIYFFVPDQQIWGMKGIKIGKIFVWLDILAFAIQLAGGSMIQPDAGKDNIMRGIHLYMGGIGAQELFILIFTAVSIKFHLTMLRIEKSYSPSGGLILHDRPPNWRWLLYAVYASLTLITARIIFRMIEFAKGLDEKDNPIPYREAYILALDAAPILIACLLMNLIHPGRILRGEGSEFPKGPTRKEKKEAKRIKKEEKLAKKEAKKEAKKLSSNIRLLPIRR